MRQFPETPSLPDAPDALFDSGHLWLQEWVDGLPLRFALRDEGYLVFGNREREFTEDDLPPYYRTAVRNVRELFDREAFWSALEDVESVTFFGVATCLQSIEYDWDRIPAFLGYDVWSRERYVPPDTAERIFDRLGLDPAPAIAKEMRATDFTSTTYENRDSVYYDGPAAGVLIRDKTGHRALVHLSQASPVESPSDHETELSPDKSATDIVTAWITDADIRQIQRSLDPDSIAVEPVSQRLLERLYRRRCVHLVDATALDERSIEKAIHERVSQTLRE